MKFLSALKLRRGGAVGGEVRFSCAENEDKVRDIAILGAKGEKLAKKLLKKKGYKFIANNYNVPGQGEIDLIFADGAAIVFVEVKTRRSESFVPAEKVVHFGKQKKLFKAADKFVRVNKLYDRPLRFDVVIVIDDDGNVEVRHYENAFRPGKR
ncbi:MAG: YraN family protein [Phycisphaerae bacterium]|nr:YraN family protein [Phycisphaerae bacterium]